MAELNIGVNQLVMHSFSSVLKIDVLANFKLISILGITWVELKKSILVHTIS